VRGRTEKTAERVAEARRLRVSGWTLREIGERFGVSLKTIHTWLADPELERQRQRREGYRGTCIDCGAPTDGSRGPSSPVERCRACNNAIVLPIGAALNHERAKPRYERLAVRWREGATTAELAAEEGVAIGTIHSILHHMRAQGYDLPYRYAKVAERHAALGAAA
jgi:transposase